MRRNFNETIAIQMSLKLALSLLTACLTFGAGAITWAYAIQQRIIDQTDQRREMRLQAYPSSLQLQTMFQSMESSQQANYIDLRNRIDAVRVLLYQRTPKHP